MKSEIEDIEDIIPKVDLFLDLDETLVRNDCSSGNGSPIFNGANDPGELGPLDDDVDFSDLSDFKGFAAIKDWPENYKDIANIHIKVLTARPIVEISSFKIAKILDLKPRLKSTGQEFESKTGEIYFAMHYPAYGQVYVLLDEQGLNIEFPCFVWQKKEGVLFYCYSKDHSMKLVFKPSEAAQVDSLIDGSLKTGLLDEKKHENLIQTIFKFAPVNRLITYSANGKVISNTNLDESDIDPAYHFAHVPKAWVMEKIREETPGVIVASILMDDKAYHKEHFKEKDIWVDCSRLANFDFGSEGLAQEVEHALACAEEKICSSVCSFGFFKMNIIALAPILVENISVEAKLSSFILDKRCVLHSKYTDAIFERENFGDTDHMKFLRLMMLCDDFVILSKGSNMKAFDEEKESVNPLDSLLEFANLNCWAVKTKHGSFQIFSEWFPDGIQKIRIFLEKENRTEKDYANLLESLNNELLEPMMDLFPPEVFIFYNLIIKLDTIQSLKLPGFNQAAKIIKEEFRNELGLQPLPKQVVIAKTSEMVKFSS